MGETTMSNVSRPSGFRPWGHSAGGIVRPSALAFTLAAAYAANIFEGDVVKLADTGLVQVAAAGDTNLLGVFAGVQWIDPDGSVRFSKYWPSGQVVKANTTPEVHLYDDPKIIYEVQAFAGTIFAQTMVGNNCDLKANTAGSTLTGQSGMELDISTTAATTGNFRILGVSPGVGNDPSAENVKLLVMMVESVMSPAGTMGI
jgi:hypothetical protein